MVTTAMEAMRLRTHVVEQAEADTHVLKEDGVEDEDEEEVAMGKPLKGNDQSFSCYI